MQHRVLAGIITAVLGMGAALPAPAQTPDSVVLARTHKELDHRLAVSDTSRFLQSSFRYPSVPRIPDPDDPAFAPSPRVPLSVPLGFACAAQGALVGYMRNHDAGEVSGLDGSAIATGTFLGWTLGTTIGIAADEGLHPAGVLSALCLAGAGVFLVQETDMEGLYLPLAILQVAVSESLRR